MQSELTIGEEHNEVAFAIEAWIVLPAISR